MVAIIIITIAVVLEATIHWYIITKKKRDPKKDGAIMAMRTIIYIAIAMGFAGAAYEWSLENVLRLLGWISAVVMIRWSVFDYALNLMRGKDLFHLGDITWDDKIESKINGYLLLVLKLITFAGVSAAVIA
jgi:hypothetical protein